MYGIVNIPSGREEGTILISVTCCLVSGENKANKLHGFFIKDLRSVK